MAIRIWPPGLQVNNDIQIVPANGPRVRDSFTMSEIFSATADKTVANTVTETTLFGAGVGSLTIPASTFVPGNTLRIKMRGYIAGTASPTVRLRAKINSITIVDTTALGSLIGATNGFIIDCLLTCRTIGPTGTFIGQIFAMVTSATYFVQTTTNATTTIDTSTTGQPVDLTFQWGAASASNTVTITNATVELTN